MYVNKALLLFFTCRYPKKQFQIIYKNSNEWFTSDECLGFTDQVTIKMDKTGLSELFKVSLQG